MEHPHPSSRRPSRNRPARRLFLLLFLLVAGVAGPAAADDAPRFLIEKIAVKGNRRPASARIVVSESLLVAGQTYSENQLRDAVYRIKRLPFVIEADFALQKGSERGRYELVITVEESRPLFVGYNRAAVYEDQALVPRSSRVLYGGGYTLGARELVGSEGLVFAAADLNTYQVGYTRYDLFGPGSFLSLAVSADHQGRAPSSAISAGIPLTFNQSLRATVAWINAGSGQIAPGESAAARSVDLDWLYDTTDDPLFPTRGTQGGAAVSYSSSRSVFKTAGEPEFRFAAHGWGLNLSGNRYWPVSAHQSVFLGLHGSASSGSSTGLVPEGTIDNYQAGLTFGHALDLLSGERARRWGDLRLESAIAYSGFYFHEPGLPALGPNPGYQLSLSTGLVFRNPWAVLRLSLGYTGKVM